MGSKHSTHGKIRECIQNFVWTTSTEETTWPKEGNIETNLKETRWGGVDWIHLAKDRDQWLDLVSTVMDLQDPLEARNLNNWAIVSFSRRTKLRRTVHRLDKNITRLGDWLLHVQTDGEVPSVGAEMKLVPITKATSTKLHASRPRKESPLFAQSSLVQRC
jgi:hypothetical protein